MLLAEWPAQQTWLQTFRHCAGCAAALTGWRLRCCQPRPGSQMGQCLRAGAHHARLTRHRQALRCRCQRAQLPAGGTMHLATGQVGSDTDVLDGAKSSQATAIQPADARCMMQFRTQARGCSRPLHESRCLTMTRPSSWREASTSTFLRASGSFTWGLRTRATCNMVRTTQRDINALVQSFLAIFLLHHTVKSRSQWLAQPDRLRKPATLPEAAAGWCAMGGHCGSWDCSRHARGLTDSPGPCRTSRCTAACHSPRTGCRQSVSLPPCTSHRHEPQKLLPTGACRAHGAALA